MSLAELRLEDNAPGLRAVLTVPMVKGESVPRLAESRSAA